MQKLVLRVYDVVKCKKIYSVDRNPVYTDLQICAGGIAGRDSCGGDSGARAAPEGRLKRPSGSQQRPLECPG